MNSPASSPISRAVHSLAWPAAIAGTVLVVGSGIAYSIEKSLMFHAQIGASIGAIFLLSAALARPRAVQIALIGRSAKYSSYAYLTSAAFLGILAFINFIGFKYDHEIDLTETRLFTLSPETIAVLKGIDEPVQVIGFFKPGDPRAKRTREILERYSHYTTHLTYQFHDPHVNPTLARSYELENYGIIFSSSDHRYQADTINEQTITGGLMRVTNHMQHVVYFLSGHGERQLEDSGEQGFSRLKQILTQENYRVAELKTVSAPIPNDAAAVIIAGAAHSLSRAETQRLISWMADGGKLMIMADPTAPGPAPEILQSYGLSLPDSTIIEDMNHALVTLDTEGFMPQIFTPMVIHYPYHEITRGLNGIQSFFPLARPVLMIPMQDPSKSTIPIVTTSAGSWAETDLPSIKPVFDKTADLPGPHHLAVAAEDSQTNSRLALFGDTDFVANQNISTQAANADLFINTINWLTQDQSLIAIHPKTAQDRRLFLTMPQINLILFSAVIMLPLVIFTNGIIVWWKRR